MNSNDLSIKYFRVISLGKEIFYAKERICRGQWSKPGFLSSCFITAVLKLTGTVPVDRKVHDGDFIRSHPWKVLFLNLCWERIQRTGCGLGCLYYFCMFIQRDCGKLNCFRMDTWCLPLQTVKTRSLAGINFFIMHGTAVYASLCRIEKRICSVSIFRAGRRVFLHCISVV